MDRAPAFQIDIDALRTEIESVSSEIEWVSTSPIPKDELRQRIGSACKALGERFDLEMARLANPAAGQNELREILTLSARVPVLGDGIRLAHAGIEMGGLLAAVFDDDLAKRLCKKVDGLDYVAGPPAKDRPEALRKLRDELRTLEVREEALICAAEEQGVYIARREDAPPEIVLGYDPCGESPDIGPRRVRRGVVVVSG